MLAIAGIVALGLAASGFFAVRQLHATHAKAAPTPIPVVPPEIT